MPNSQCYTGILVNILGGIKYDGNHVAKEITILPTYNLFISRHLNLPSLKQLSCIYHTQLYLPFTPAIFSLLSFVNQIKTCGKITNSKKKINICDPRMFLSYEASIFRRHVCHVLLRFVGCEGLSNSVLSKQIVLLLVFIRGSYIQCLGSVGRVEITTTRLLQCFDWSICWCLIN